MKKLMFMRTPGGAVVTWAYTSYTPDGYWGAFECSGCLEFEPQLLWKPANDHAKNCHVIPDWVGAAVELIRCPIHRPAAECLWTSPEELRAHLRRWSNWSEDELDELVRDAERIPESS